MKLKKIILGSLLATLVSFGSNAQDKSVLFQKEEFASSNGSTLKYRILYPENYDRSKAYPVIVFLHGSGERGDDNDRQLFLCATSMIVHARCQSVQPIVIFPQCPAETSWSIGRRPDADDPDPASYVPPVAEPIFAMKEKLDDMVAKGIADPAQLHVTGLSMGGFGTFDMLSRYPETFATATPICGGGYVPWLEKYNGKAAIRIYHGDKDASVDVENSRKAYAALQKAGADVSYKEYVNVGHNSWDNAVAEPDFVSWMLDHKLNR